MKNIILIFAGLLFINICSAQTDDDFFVTYTVPPTPKAQTKVTPKWGTWLPNCCFTIQPTTRDPELPFYDVKNFNISSHNSNYNNNNTNTTTAATTIPIPANLEACMLFAGWRNSYELMEMTHSDIRNSVIVEMEKHSDGSISFFQSQSDNQLLDYSMIAIILFKKGYCTPFELNNMSVHDQRNRVIVELHNAYQISVSELQAKSNMELADIAFHGLR